jgi:hypothetical protein
MRTIPFSTILYEASQLCGLDRDQIQAKTFRVLRDFCSNRLNEIWNREQWPFLVRYLNTLSGREVTQIQTTAGSPLVTFTTPYNLWPYSALNYNGAPALINVDTTIANEQIGAPLITGAFPYTSTPTTTSIILNVGSNQASSTTYTLSGSPIAALWSESDDEYRVRLPSDCEALLGVYTHDPRSTTKAVPVGYYIESLGSPLTGGLFSTWYDYAVLKQQLNCFLQYRISCPRLAGEDWAAGDGYDVGNQVYYAGEFWDAASSSLGSPPSETGNNAFWQKVAIPELFRAFLVRAILADYLRSESQFDQAAAAEIDAQAAYERAVDFVLRQQQQSGKLNMVYTY